MRCPTDLDYSNSNQNRRKPTTQNCMAWEERSVRSSESGLRSASWRDGNRVAANNSSVCHQNCTIDRATVIKEPSSRVDDHWTPTRGSWPTTSLSLRYGAGLCDCANTINIAKEKSGLLLMKSSVGKRCNLHQCMVTLLFRSVVEWPVFCNVYYSLFGPQYRGKHPQPRHWVAKVRTDLHSHPFHNLSYD